MNKESTDQKRPFYLRKNESLQTCIPADDFLHPDQNALVDDYSVTETQYFGFYIPEQAISGFSYLWHHPKMQLVTGGLMVWQGDKPYQLAAELCDYREFMPDKCLQNDILDYRLDNGYGVKVVEPLQQFHLTYQDDQRDCSVNVYYKAISETVLLDEGNHFEQPMHATGELLLRGERYQIDCYHMRDRSWGRPRQEVNNPLPPVGWFTAVFDEYFSINATTIDDVRFNPEISQTFTMPAENLVTSAWVRRGGQVLRILSAEKKLKRDPGSHFVREVDIVLTDESGHSFRLVGKRFNALPWAPMPNMLSILCGMRWECEGKVTHGEYVDTHWNSYLGEIYRATV